MLRYDHLLGIPFKHGTDDCYTLGQRFFFDNFGLKLSNYARPDNWWKQGMNLYMDNLRKEGFEVLQNVHPTDYRPGDVFMCAIMSPVANHGAILLEDGEILHHLYGRLSTKEPIRGLIKNTTVAVVRHPKVIHDPKTYTEDLLENLPASIRAQLAIAPVSRGEGEGGVRPEDGTDRGM